MIEQWGIFEAAVRGRDDGNPFTDYDIFGEFTLNGQTVTARGFYDGGGVYRGRFMPQTGGSCTYRIYGSFSDRETRGSFEVSPAQDGNHGPVHVRDAYHFCYADGTPYFPFGTTCYVWHLQDDETIAQTLRTLKTSPFNKMRFCIFPKHYDFNLKDPRSFPYEGEPMDASILTPDNFYRYTGKSEGNSFDYERFNPEYFRHIEKCILALQDMGIEADLICMHPYDRWGFSTMTEAQDDLYWRYIIARFASYRNVWWSLANEYDLLFKKTQADWERYASILVSEDPYHHLRSIHNCIAFYDHSRPWITHASIQRQDLYRTTEYVDDWRERWGKPVVCDEIAYEGDIPHGWGNISGRELTRRCWEAALRGGYPGHGETYLGHEDRLWWSHGGRRWGESPDRIAFLRKIIEENPHGLRRLNTSFDELCAIPDTPGAAMSPVQDYYLYYYGFGRPSWRDYHIDEDTSFQVDVIDTWNMTIADAGVHRGRFRIALPARESMAVRLRRVDSAKM